MAEIALIMVGGSFDNLSPDKGLVMRTGQVGRHLAPVGCVDRGALTGAFGGEKVRTRRSRGTRRPFAQCRAGLATFGAVNGRDARGAGFGRGWVSEDQSY
jgi:hypothetical protein